METYFKTIGIIIIGVILSITLSQKAKDFSILVMIMLCCAVCATAVIFLKPILSFLNELEDFVPTNNQWLSILLKAAGLSFIGETSAAVCAEAGHASVGKTLQLLTTVSILWVSLPMIESLLELIKSILELL